MTASTFYDEALSLYKLGRLREAEIALLKIGDLKNHHLLLLAQVRMGKGLWLGALRCLDQISPTSQHLPACLVMRGNVFKELDRFEDALEAYDQALMIEGKFLPALTNRAALHLLMGNVTHAESDLALALRIKPGFADASFHMACICLQRGDFAIGWRLYESRLKTSLTSALAKRYPEQHRWSGCLEGLPNKTLLVYGEQGLGDMIQFSRFLPMLMSKGITVILQMPKTLHRIFAHNWPSLMLTDVNESFKGGFDRHCSLVSLPHLLGLQDPHASPWMTRRIGVKEPMPSKKPRVGVVWSGLSVRDLERYTTTRRSMPLEVLKPLLNERLCFVSLQPYPRAEDLEMMKRLGIQDASPELTDFFETARLIESLDMVISIDTSVIHLAGAMGTPSLVFLPKVSDYRWTGSGQGSAWYPGIKIFRQEVAGDWALPVANAGLYLKSHFGLA